MCKYFKNSKIYTNCFVKITCFSFNISKECKEIIIKSICIGSVEFAKF